MRRIVGSWSSRTYRSFRSREIQLARTLPGCRRSTRTSTSNRDASHSRANGMYTVLTNTRRPGADGARPVGRSGADHSGQSHQRSELPPVVAPVLRRAHRPQHEFRHAEACAPGSPVHHPGPQLGEPVVPVPRPQDRIPAAATFRPDRRGRPDLVVGLHEGLQVRVGRQCPHRPRGAGPGYPGQHEGAAPGADGPLTDGGTRPAHRPDTAPCPCSGGHSGRVLHTWGPDVPGALPHRRPTPGSDGTTDANAAGHRPIDDQLRFAGGVEPGHRGAR